MNSRTIKKNISIDPSTHISIGFYNYFGCVLAYPKNLAKLQYISCGFTQRRYSYNSLSLIHKILQNVTKAQSTAPHVTDLTLLSYPIQTLFSGKGLGYKNLV